MTVSPTADLQTERLAVNSYLNQALSLEGSANNGIVHDAMRYAVLGSAQRIRPILALRVARMVHAPADLAMRLAGSVELLHCASLVIDDLPCMDNSSYRRDRAAVHVKFGEAIAILSAFGLVALAARSILEPNCSPDYRPRLIEFQLALLRSLDCSGLIAGQALDLQLPHDSSTSPACEISELKTVPLFNLAVLAGWLLANVDANERALLNCFGRQFGLAFQMSDDLLDGELANAAPFAEKLSTLRAAIEPFGAASRSLEELIDYLHARVSERGAALAVRGNSCSPKFPR
jgi:geranylgeranyl pyrophosphate synthase